MHIFIKIKILFLILFLKTISCQKILKYKWMHYQSYGSTVNLEPLFNNTECNNQTKCYWLLPNKITKLNYPILDNNKYSMTSNGTLIIINIQSNDNGIYHFFKMNYTKWIVSKSLLNIHGPPYQTLWLEYWPNIVGGLVAMAVVLITFILIILADKYRYRPPKRIIATIERTNPVFISDDNNTVVNQKQSRRSSSISNATDLRIEKL